MCACVGQACPVGGHLLAFRVQLDALSFLPCMALQFRAALPYNHRHGGGVSWRQHCGSVCEATDDLPNGLAVPVPLGPHRVPPHGGQRQRNRRQRWVPLDMRPTCGGSAVHASMCGPCSLRTGSHAQIQKFTPSHERGSVWTSVREGERGKYFRSVSWAWYNVL